MGGAWDMLAGGRPWAIGFGTKTTVCVCMCVWIWAMPGVPVARAKGGRYHARAGSWGGGGSTACPACGKDAIERREGRGRRD